MQRTLFIIAGVGVLVVLALVTFGLVTRQKPQGWVQSVASLVDRGSDCPSGPLFTVSPIEPSQILAITPLGNLNPPDHTIPTDHVYFVVKQGNEVHPGDAKAVVAPGAITVTRISHSRAERTVGPTSDDYDLNYTVCRGRSGHFGHVTALAPAIQAGFDSGKPRCTSYHPRPEDTYSTCNVDLTLKVSVGQPLGEAGGGTATGLDVWAFDTSQPPLQFANPKRYRSNEFTISCPLDGFSAPVRAILEAKLGAPEQRRTVEPRCGTIAQDVVGTAQGNWLAGTGLIDEPQNWAKSLTLAHDNVDPTVGVISVGGVVSEPGRLVFEPRHVGVINREFGEVTPSDAIYCYSNGSFQRRNIGRPFPRGQQLLIRLTSATQLDVEAQPGDCTGLLALSTPIRYNR